MTEWPRYEAAQLEEFAERAFVAMGVPADSASTCARTLIQSELRFHPGQGQGLKRLPHYERRISRKQLDPGAPFEIVKESAALALVDAHNGLGSVIGQRAMEIAADKAAAVGFGAVVVRGSTHFGSASLHALVAAERGCLGIAFTNAGPEMAAWGGRTPVTGTNPWGLAAPTGAEFPVVLDIALTTAGKGMMGFLAEQNRKMPLDWALTPEGLETDDPAAAMAGALLGIGQYKGYGLAVMTDVLTGVISGGGFGLAPYSNPAKLDVSHTFLAIDIGWFMPREEFHHRMQQLIAELKASELRPGFTEVLVPGELEYRRQKERLEGGIPLSPEDVAALQELATKLQLAPAPFSG